MEIGIIGAGISGCSAAKFLRDELGEDANIVVFERDSRIGGRVRDVSIAGGTFEAGGKLIHSRAEYINSFIDEFGFETNSSTEFGEHKLGVWNGQSFSFTTSGRKWRTVLDLFRRYGLSYFRTQSGVRDAMEKYQRIYTQADAGFSRPIELFDAIGLEPHYRESGYTLFERAGVNDRFIRELINPITRAFYGQDASMNGLACVTSLAGIGNAGSIYTLSTSNVELCRALLEDARAELKSETPVRTISYSPSGDRNITVSTPSGEHSLDTLCIATPLEAADFEIRGLELSSGNRRYIDMSVAFVDGEVDPAYFGKDERGSVPNLVVTEASEETDFVHLLKRDGPVPGDRSVYKLTARGDLSRRQLQSMFDTVEDVEQVDWKAFPRYDPTTEDYPFELAPGVYYVNAMESIVSTMETQVIGSRNVSNLIVSNHASSPLSG